jgi:hypothetical protein
VLAGERGRVDRRGEGGSTGTTATGVSQFFALNVGFTQDELTAVYDPDIRARGWAPEPLDLAPDTVNGKQAALYCCKEFDGVPSFLSVIEGYIGSVDLRADVGVTPTPDAWPEAGAIEVKITAIRGIRCANA